MSFVFVQKNYELLARGSAFYVAGPITGALYALVSAHVAAPHRFRNYFPQQWLEHIRDSDCRTVLEVVDGGRIKETRSIYTKPLIHGFRHSTLDVAAFPISEDESSAYPEVSVLRLPTEDEPLKVGNRVSVAGFQLLGESGSGTEAVVSVELDGVVSEIWKSRVFVDTGSQDSEMGMCGGPVVLLHDRSCCVGMLEGMVPRVTDDLEHGHSHKRLQGKSVLVSSKELKTFLHDIEVEMENLPEK